MNHTVPLPEETRTHFINRREKRSVEPTETALDQSKPQALPRKGLKPGAHAPASARRASDEHPLSVGQP